MPVVELSKDYHFKNHAGIGLCDLKLAQNKKTFLHRLKLQNTTSPLPHPCFYQKLFKISFYFLWCNVKSSWLLYRKKKITMGEGRGLFSL